LIVILKSCDLKTMDKLVPEFQQQKLHLL